MSDVKRITYRQENGSIIVARGSENMDLPIESLLETADLKQHLAIYGINEYLRRAAADVPAEDKMTAIEQAYDRLVEQGVDAFKRRTPVRTAPTKAEKVSALATLEGVTTVAIQQALAEKTKEEQDEILNSQRVADQLESMQRSGEGLQLTA